MELTEKIPKRVQWIDIFKGIAILLMVIGHAASPFNGYIYLFHMGAFLFISGYTSKLNKVSLDILFLKKILGLLLPYYSLSIISIFLLALLHSLGIYDNLFGNNYIEIKGAIKLLFDGYNVSTFLGATWFLIVLFNVFIVQKLLLICSRNKVKYLYFVLSLILFLVGYYFVRIKISSPKLMIDLVFIAQFYFALGVMASEATDIIKNKSIISWIAAPISIGLLYYFKNVNYAGVDYPSREFGNILNNFLAATSGIVILIILSQLLVKTKLLKQQLILFGKNTLGILFFHFLYFKAFFIIMVFLFQLDKEIWFLKHIPESNNNYWLIISLFSVYLSIFTWKCLQKSEYISIFLGANQNFNRRVINNYQRLRTKLIISERR